MKITLWYAAIKLYESGKQFSKGVLSNTKLYTVKDYLIKFTKNYFMYFNKRFAIAEIFNRMSKTLFLATVNVRSKDNFITIVAFRASCGCAEKYKRTRC